MVTKYSAAPSRPTENPHDRLPRDVDHSGLSKFHDRSDRDYETFRQRIVDCTQVDTTGALDDDLCKELPRASQAAFNSADKEHDPLCLQDTRVDVLNEIRAWADGEEEKCIFWLNGMAGTGKSTIARTVAREICSQGRLGASFFFLRDM